MVEATTRQSKRTRAQANIDDDNEVNTVIKRVKLNNGKESPVQVQTKEESKDQHTFEVKGTLIVSKHNYDSIENISADKVAAFDMDWTLIRVKSGATFAKNAYDWSWWNECVPKKLQSLHQEGYRIVVCTNQGGIATGKARTGDLKIKFKDIAKAAGVPMIFLGATHEDKYRKPSTGMFDFFEQTVNKQKIDRSKSFFCGDAAGRPANGIIKKDFSADDLRFAINLDIEFHTPESLFLGQNMNNVPDLKAKAAENAAKKQEPIIVGGQEGDENKLSKDKPQEVVVFCGSPGSGKSTFWNNYFKDYERVNNDTLKTPQKCMKATEQALINKKSVVIDNTNPDKMSRGRYINIAKDFKIQVRCIYFDVPKDICLHNNEQRRVNTHRDHFSRAISKIPIHSFHKNHVAPATQEGFSEIVKIRFVPGPFKNESDEQSWRIM